MKYCRNCGNQVNESDKFCSNCGTKLFSEEKIKSEPEILESKIKICDTCGEENSFDADECSYCGVGFTGEEKIIIKKIAKTHSENILEKDVRVKSHTHAKTHPQQKLKKKSTQKSDKVETKVLSTKYIIFFLLIVSIFLLILIYSGYESSKPSQRMNQIQNQEMQTSIDLNALSEINQLETELKNDPDNQQKLLRLANLSHDSGFFEKAINYYKKYLQLNPVDDDARVDMGVCYFELKNYDEAEKIFESVVKKNPKHQIAYLNLGIVNLTKGEVEKAKSYFKNCIELGEHTDAGHRAAELLKSH